MVGGVDEGSGATESLTAAVVGTEEQETGAPGIDRDPPPTVVDDEDRSVESVAPKRRRRRGWLIGIGALVVVGAAIAVVVVITRRGGPDHPSTWDPRVVDLVRYVERHKGAFEHPVTVVYLDDAEFEERLSIDEGLSDDDRKEIEQAESVLRALGLQGGEGSLLDQANTLQTEGVAAYYDPEEQQIVIPKSEPESLATNATLVHELTHARQDQLGQLEDVDESEDEEGRKALIEGEADHIKDQWIDTLSEDERNDLEDEQQAQSDDAEADLDAVNPALVAMFAAPYSLGGPMVAAIDDAGRVIDAFDAPPPSSGDIFDPNRWLEPVRSVSVGAPALEDDEDALGDDEQFGAYGVYMLLATALEPADALAAADGWAGDRMQVYRDADDRTCVRLDVVGVDDAAADRLADGIGTWVGSRPDGSASSTRHDDHIVLDACDAGAGSTELTDEQASLPGVRASLVPVLLDQGAPARMATCMSVEFIANFPSELFAADELTDDQQDLASSTWLDARETCDS